MRAIILISALFICDSLARQNGERPQDKDSNGSRVTFLWIALIYAIVLDLNE